MRVDTAAFGAKNAQLAKRPRYTIEVAFDSANSILWYFTSHTDAATPPGASVIANVIEGLSGSSQKLDPDKAIASIGNITFNVVDTGGTVTSTLGAELALGRSTRRQRVRVYVGYEGLAWADYSLVQTQLVTSIEWKEGAYQFSCMDVQRQLRKDIFDLAKTQLAASIADADTTVQVVATSAFTMVAHGTSYTDAPSATVGYIKIEDEVIRYTGKTATTFTGCTRGALNTRATAHNADLTVAADQRTPVEEYVYLEMPAVKLMYALLTGTLYNQGGATLPTTWHMGVDTAFVQLADFTGKPDLWDTADDTKGFPVRFEDLTKQDGKAFLEKELALLLGAYMPIYASGAIGLRKMASVLAGAAYTQLLDESNIVSCTQLKHDFESLHNILQISWNWEPLLKAFTRINILADANSITVHNKSDPLDLEFRGLAGSIHSSTSLAKRFDALRDRYSGPPLRITVDVVPSLNALEIGDVVRVKLAKVRDFVANSSLDRSFEIQNIKMDWVTGGMTLDLFASSQAASAQAPSTDATAISDAWYTSQGTNLASVLTITGSNPGHVSANGAIAGSTDMNAAGSIFYYNGDLQIDSGKTVTLTGNVQLRIKGFLQNNGTINGKGGGIAGAASAAASSATSSNAGTAGFIGTTEAGGGYSTVRVNSGFGGSSLFYQYVNSVRGKVVNGQYPVVPPIELKWNGSTLAGIPTEMRGTAGSSGMPYYPDPATGFAAAAGGAGGASGSGLCVVSRGFALGASAKIDLSGGDGSNGSFTDAQNGIDSVSTRWRAGSGAGGAPGALIVLLDGANQSATGISEQSVLALQGKTPILPTVANTPANYFPGATVGAGGQVTSFYVGSGDGTTFALPTMSGSRGASRVQFVPANTTPVADAGTALKPPSELQGLLSGGTLTAVWNPTTDPMVAGYDLQYRLHSGSWPTSPTVSVTPGTANSATLATGLGAGPYDVRIRSAGSLRQVGAWIDQQRLVQTLDITDSAVTTPKIVDSGVTTVKLGDASVTTVKVVDANITTPKIADINVTTAKLADASVVTAKLGALSVTSTILADGSVSTAKLVDVNVTTAKLADLNVTLAKMALLSVDSTILVDAAVTNAKVATDAITQAKLADNAVGTAELVALSVTTAKVAAAAITTNEIAALTIVAGNIAAATITGGKIVAGTITASNIAADTITANEIAASAITTSELAAGAVTAAKITAGTITSNEIASATIVAGNIAAATITAAKLNIASLSAIAADLGTITAGSITLDTAGFIKGGASGYMTGTGFWMGYSGAYKFHIGNPSGNNVHWDGTSLFIDATLTSASVVLSGTDGSGNASIQPDTADGADNKSVSVNGGGGFAGTRGAQLQVDGNEYTNAPGRASLVAGIGDGSNSATTKAGWVWLGTYNTAGTGGARDGVNVTQEQNVLIGEDTSTTSRTGSLLFIPGSAGTPSGTPTSYGARRPMVYDTTNDVLYVYNSGWKRSGSGITELTEQATTSGTTKDFTIASGAKKIVVQLCSVSAGASTFLIQLGDAGGIETTGYHDVSLASGGSSAAPTNGFAITVNAVSTSDYSGEIILTRANSSTNKWTMSGNIAAIDTGGGTAQQFYVSAGHKATSQEVSTVRLTTVSADTFTLGTVNVQVYS